MKFFVVIGRIIFFLSAMALLTCARTPVLKENHSIALILKVNGEGDKIAAVSVYNFTFFNGRVKAENEKYAGDNALHIKIKDESDSIIFENYIENPLTKNLESFDENGFIEKVYSPKREDYVNLRFKLPEEVKELNICCYQVINNEKEKIISIFKVKLK